MPMHIRALSLALLIPCISGCSTIKSYFPDKEKDYRFTNELPELVIPEDLKNSPVVPKALSAAPAPSTPKEAAVASNTAAENAPPPAENPHAHRRLADEMQGIPADSTHNYAAEVDTSDKQLKTEAEIVHAGEPSAYLRVNQSLERTWRIVGKALSRKSIEITKRNTADYVYVVQYEPVVKAMTDNSIWDSLDFMFGAENNQEREYHIALSAVEQQTHLKITDAQHKSCEDEKCHKLMSLVQEAIREAAVKDE